MNPKKINPMWRRYGAEVRKRRKALGWSQGRLGGKVSLSSSAISLIESGSLRPQPDHAHALDAALGADGTLTRMWENFSNQGIFPAGFEKLSDFERNAVELHEYHHMLIPGLVQTPEYARAVFASTRFRDNEQSIERMLASRLERQRAVFDRPDQPLLLVVLDEIVIRRVIDDEAVAHAQLDYLIRLVEERKMRLQVVPFNTKPHPGLSGPFRVYVFRGQPTIASCEYFFDEQVVEDEDQVRQCVATFAALLGEALSTGKSVDLVRQVQGELQ